jgi:DNA-binding NarL/FixJ family response regulator
MDTLARLELGRQAHQQQMWTRAFTYLTEADADQPLAAADLELAAEAANMLGRGDDEVRILRRAFLAHAGAGRVRSALRCGYWLCKSLAFDGEFAQARAWLARASRLAEAAPADDTEYLIMLQAEQHFRAGEYATLLPIARRLSAIARQSNDPDVVAGAAMTLGNALIATGEIELGLSQLDEAMVTAAAGDLSARATGMIYCVVIGTCQELHELRRAREWSAALADWCNAQPEFTGAYRGLCRVHRVAILRLGGGWPDALREARLACQQLSGGHGQIVAGGAFYQLADLHRLRGEVVDAERAYREALRYGWDTQPGMAMLRLLQGKKDVAAAAIRRALAEASKALHRARLLPAAVDISLAVDDLSGARQAADELTAIASEYDTTALHAAAAYATGAVRLAEGDPERASALLRQAFQLWRELDVPYEAARTRELIALVCRAMGDDDSAAMELEAARQVFAELGAGPDIARLDGSGPRLARATGLSPRELEVIRLLAAGLTNHAIAAELFLSEKTVARHISNIFGKLGVASRTAAAAYAYEHGLV